MASLSRQVQGKSDVESARENMSAQADADSRLRWTVRQLGNVLGETVVEQEGQAIFDLVEELRRLTRAQRQGDQNAGTQIERLTTRLVDDLDGTLGVLKAFTSYFQLVNLAEEQQRVRVVRQRAARAEENGPPMPETIQAAVKRLRTAGTPAQEMRRLLDEMLIKPVFTAHPTEAKRRTILLKLLDLSRLLRELDDHVLLPSEKTRTWEQIREIVVSLWQSDVNRERRPDVLDEVREGLYFFDTTLFDLLPDIYMELQLSLLKEYPDDDGGVENPSGRPPTFLRYGSWIGGTATATRSLPSMSPRTLSASRNSRRWNSTAVPLSACTAILVSPVLAAVSHKSFSTASPTTSNAPRSATKPAWSASRSSLTAKK